jgi:undecaprenyl-phosphate 4-deoxy-4-formamido-L-arabinose transferase
MTRSPQYSLIVPVYNASATIEALVREIHQVFTDQSFEVILVNDGSSDASEGVCARLVAELPGTVRLVQLTRNFGEHGAVLAGLHHARAGEVVILDDDGQHPPGEALRLLQELQRSGCDVVYGRYRVKHHDRWRNLGSRFNDWIATVLLKKPADLYLSSFKAMNRLIVDEVTRYRGAFPYLDGLILRTTRNIGQIEVEHRPRAAGSSAYGVTKLAEVWFNMFLNFSTLPLRLAALVGLLCALGSVVLFGIIIVDKLWLNPTVTVGVPTILLTVVFFGGVQLMILGTIGEYLGRLFLDQSGAPQFVVRYTKNGEPPA